VAVSRTLEYSSRRDTKKNEENTDWRRSEDIRYVGKKKEKIDGRSKEFSR
jgi:hypothetical protein